MKKIHLSRRKKHHARKAGLPPGALVYIGNVAPEQNQPAKISKISYDSNEITECELTPKALANFKPNPHQKHWLNLHGVHDVALVKQIGEAFNLHPLVIEDILNTEQRPKIDEFDHYVFLETRLFYYHQESMSVSSEQISMVLGSNFLLTFQERSTGAFEPVRERLRASRAQMRTLGIDYLAYALLDSIVDKYFNVLEEVGEASETLEEQLLTKPTNAELHSIHQLKHVSIELRRAVWPLREVINTLTRNEKGFFQPATMPYLRDVYDHTVNFIESLESIRDSLSGMMDIYMASVSQRVNLELRALTVVAMLFMPATLIAGIFGMNFHYMPWLEDKHGFWWAISIMLSIALVMVLIFWRRQWLSSKT
ncbi:MAG: magnesium/cobalt transporter CorA [Methylotenera sp.]|nr:magnesium/cobalt transporter CorA [Methylotenera sp.]